jgi:hypothetical protein
VQLDLHDVSSRDECHPERSRFSGVAKDLLLNRPSA